MNNPRWCHKHRRPGSNIRQHNGRWPDPCSISDRHLTDYDCPSAYLNAVTQLRSFLNYSIGSRRTDSNVLADHTVVADLSMRMDDDPVLMPEHQPPPHFGRRWKFDAVVITHIPVHHEVSKAQNRL
jgi:hypothetical protein